MKKMFALASIALLLSSCGGNSNDDKPSHNINVTGNWAGSLQTTTGGGLGAVEATLSQPSGTAFTGTLTTPIYGGNHPVVGDVAKGTLQTDLSASGVNKDAAISCTGAFTNTTYKGTCTVANNATQFVLSLNKK